jgi:hypothetical protein
MGESLANASLGNPIAEARLESGSASIARTFLPRSAKSRAITPASVVFPTPPFPEMAIFIISPSTKKRVIRIQGLTKIRNSDFSFRDWMAARLLDPFNPFNLTIISKKKRNV